MPSPDVSPISPESIAAPVADAAAASKPVDRLVLFLSGFDPKGPAFYHRLMRDEARVRPARGLERVEVSARSRTGAETSGWTLSWIGADAAESPTTTRYEFLRWDDIVRRHWPRNVWQRWQDYAQVYGTGFGQGIFAWYWRRAYGAFVLMMLPAVAALAVVGSAFGALFMAARVAGAGPWLSAALSVAPTVWLWRWAERRLETEWVLRLYCFSLAQARGELPELEDRIDRFADILCEALARQAAKEIVIVGYSSGSILAASVVARAMTRQPGLWAQAGRTVALLTLGHCTPLLGLFPGADRFRAELKCLAESPDVVWIDYSSPADMAAFGLVDPWMGAARGGVKQRLSPRFHAVMPADEYRRLRRDRRSMHLHYLRSPPAGFVAAHRGGPSKFDARRGPAYDYFALVGGPVTMRERFSATAPCPAPAPR